MDMVVVRTIGESPMWFRGLGADDLVVWASESRHAKPIPASQSKAYMAAIMVRSERGIEAVPAGPVVEGKEFGCGSSFERDTLHRMCVEAARYWVVSCFLGSKRLPVMTELFAYPNGEASLDWGNPSGPDDPDLQPMRRQRVRITMQVEDYA